ncbi:MAG: ECF transporter S component [Bacilli bacterium]|nr:ECF transporter S component [Bacilli bacterium]
MSNVHPAIKKMIQIAIFGALCYVLTVFIRIPSGFGGYFHLGDSIVILSAILFGPLVGSFVGIIGCGMADVSSGFIAFLPYTIVAKALLAIMTWAVFKCLKNSSKRRIAPIAGSYVQACIYYFAYKAILGEYTYGVMEFFGMAFWDFFQGLVCSALAFIVLKFLTRTNYFSSLRLS